MDLTNALTTQELAAVLVVTTVVAVAIGTMTDPAVGGSRAVSASVAAVVAFVVAAGTLFAIN
jgi:hypothetical protein